MAWWRRERISQLMIGRYFAEPSQLDRMAPSVRSKIERIAAPLAQVESKADWSLTLDVQSAVNILDQARRLSVKSVDDFIRQEGLFAKDKYSPDSIALAKALQTAKPKELKAAVRQYAQDAAFAAKGEGLFGETPPPEQSFADSIGSVKSGARSDADGAIRQARNAQYSGKILRIAPEDLAQVSYRPGPKGAPGILYGNASATELMSHLLGGNGFTGVNLTPELADLVSRRARWELYNSALPKAMRNELRQFADQFDQVVALKRGLNYLEAESGAPIPAIKGTASEEAFHAQQTRLGGGTDVGHIGDASLFMKSRRLAERAGDALVREYGYADDPDNLAAEIGAKLAAGRWGEIGLSESEAQDLAYQYARALVMRHGPGVVFELRRISPILKEAFHEAGRYGAEPPENFPGTPGTTAKPM